MSIKLNFLIINTLLFFGFLLGIHSVNGQLPEVAWEKQIAVQSSHYFADVTEISEGHFILAGALEMPGDRGFDPWLLECDASGDTVRTRVFEGAGDDILMRIVSHPDGGFLVSWVNRRDVGLLSRLMAVDASFNLQWTVDADRKSIIQQSDVTVDGAGNIWWLNTFAGENEMPEVSLRKMDARGAGQEEWIIREGKGLAGFNIRSLPDGLPVITCQVQSAEGIPTVMVMRPEAGGGWQWKTLLPHSGKCLTPHCLCCSTGNALLVGGWAGLCWNPDAPENEQVWDYDYLLSKLDVNGKVLWSKQYNREGSEKGTALAALPDGHIMAAGKCETSYSGTTGLWLIFVDANGEIMHERVTRFRVMRDQVSRIICTADGGFLLVGPGWQESDEPVWGWIKKLNSL